MNNIYMKLHKGKKLVSYLLPLTIALSACSDWGDHYDANASISGTSDKTLWETISQTSELSDFAKILKNNKYDQLLNGDETFTVWAPLNGTFDTTAVSSSGNVLTQFLQNHIAHNSYPASGSVDEHIFALNSKSHTFVGNGSYTINDVKVEKANIPNTNGVLHTLNGYIPFRYNIYESLNADTYPLDSISHFVHSYDVSELDESKSAVGPVVDGVQTYLDSVVVKSNILIPDANNQNRGYGAYISTEDSNYTMVVPTNTAWIKAKETLNSLFTYASSYKYLTQAPEKKAVESTDSTLKTLQIEDVAAYRDSITNYNLWQNLIFNNNRAYNKALNDLATGESLVTDSLMTVNGIKYYGSDATAMFSGATRVDKSNGAMWISDDVEVHPWIGWSPKLTVEAEWSYYQKGVYNGSVNRESVNSSNRNTDVPGKISDGGYCEVSPSSSSTNPIVAFSLGEVRSETYNIYVVVVPGNIINSSVTPLPNIFRATIGYNDENGVLKEKSLKSSITSDASKVDTLFLGEFTFPVCYYGIDEAYPYLRLESRVTPGNRDKYDRTLRIDRIMLIPTEMDTYIKDHPNYKYEED